MRPRTRVPDTRGDLDDGVALAMIIQGTTAWHLCRTAGRVARRRERRDPRRRRRRRLARGPARRARFGAGRVIATASSEASARLALELGADVGAGPDPEGLTERLVRGERRPGGRRRLRDVRRRGLRRLLPRAGAVRAHRRLRDRDEQPNRSGLDRCCATRVRWSASTSFTALSGPACSREALDELFARAQRGGAASDRRADLSRSPRPPRPRSIFASAAARASSCSTRPPDHDG